MYCEQCRSEYPEGRKFCPQCGALLKAQIPVFSEGESISCPSCGKEMQPGRKFCIYCGSRIVPGPRLCPACGAIAPPEAKFCGDCGAPFIRPGKVTLGSAKTSDLEVTERSGNSTDRELVLGEAETLPPTPTHPRQTPADDSTVTLDQTAGWKDTFFKWFRRPGLRISIEVSFLMLVALFSYRLGSHRQIKFGDEIKPPTEQIPPIPSPPQPEEGGEKREEWKIAPPEAGPVSPPQLQPSEVLEQPFSPPRWYRVTAPTALRDKPTWTGKEVAQLQRDTPIQVVATIGDWLKVESVSKPPKPPGYVWKEDARPK